MTVIDVRFRLLCALRALDFMPEIQRTEQLLLLLWHIYSQTVAMLY